MTFEGNVETRGTTASGAPSLYDRIMQEETTPPTEAKTTVDEPPAPGSAAPAVQPPAELSQPAPPRAPVETLNRTGDTWTPPAESTPPSPMPFENETMPVATIPQAGRDNLRNNFRNDHPGTSDYQRAWQEAARYRMNLPIQLDQRGGYHVEFGDSLSSVAQRNLLTAGLDANPQSVRAEMANIINLNRNRYPLDGNNQFLQTDWVLRLPRHDQGGWQPRQVIDRAPHVVPGPQDFRVSDNSGTVFHIRAQNVQIYNVDGTSPQMVRNPGQMQRYYPNEPTFVQAEPQPQYWSRPPQEQYWADQTFGRQPCINTEPRFRVQVGWNNGNQHHGGQFLPGRGQYMARGQSHCNDNVYGRNGGGYGRGGGGYGYPGGGGGWNCFPPMRRGGGGGGPRFSISLRF